MAWREQELCYSYEAFAPQLGPADRALIQIDL